MGRTVLILGAAVALLGVSGGASAFQKRNMSADGTLAGIGAGPNTAKADLLDYLPYDIRDSIREKNRFADVTLKPVRGDYEKPARLLATPTKADLEKLYPIAALRAGGIDGRVGLRCVVSSAGFIRTCDVRTERPRTSDFGDAAKTLATRMSVQAAVKDGAPLASEVDIEIGFIGPGKPLGSVLPHFETMKPASYVANIRWQAAPTLEQVVAAYPRDARERKIGGRVQMRCVFAETGRLGSCDVSSETPIGQRFGQAAKSLIPYFASVPTLPDGASMKGVQIEIPVTFDVAMLARREAGVEPRWEQRASPTAMFDVFPAKARANAVLKASTELECKVGGTGALEGCGIVRETPEGQGFGAASLKLSSVYIAPIWSADGLPLIGSSVRLPIDYDWTTALQAASR